MSKNNGDRHLSDIEPEQLTAYALGQLRGEELAAVKAAVGEGANRLPESEAREMQALADAIRASRETEPLPQSSVELRAAVEQKLKSLAAGNEIEKVALPPRSLLRWPTAVECVVLGGICCLLVALLLPAMQAARESAQATTAYNKIEQATIRKELGSLAQHSASPTDTTTDDSSELMRYQDSPPANAPIFEEAGGGVATNPAEDKNRFVESQLKLMVKPRVIAQAEDEPQASSSAGGAAQLSSSTRPYSASVADQPLHDAQSQQQGDAGQAQQQGIRQQGGQPGQGQSAGMSSADGYGSSASLARNYSGQSKYETGMQPSATESKPGVAARGFAMPGGSQPADPYSRESGEQLQQLGEKQSDYGPSNRGGQYDLAFRQQGGAVGESVRLEREEARARRVASRGVNEFKTELKEGEGRQLYEDSGMMGAMISGEQYQPIYENQFTSPTTFPYVSTFSIDVDTASYANMRRFLNAGSLPPPNAVRIEELVNYFSYDYPQPKGGEPFSVNMEAAECPWNAGHLLLRVGLKGKEIHRAERPPSNLTFLLDVSGSMADENKLPLLKTTLLMFVAELTENDRVSIVTYAGDAGLRLPPTRGNEKQKIMAAIESLSSGGSTHGSAGIQLAYEQAAQYFLKEGTNRVILATDGDLNVGVTSDDALVQLIKEKATGGTFLTVLGFGTGNLKDAKLEKLADNGNGLYAYIDGVREGRKVLVEQMSGSLVTIAKDVKIQIEFNPREIASYRLLGYENRMLAAEDFNNDKKDAGEIGAGHTVTALYELVPVGAKQAAAVQPVAVDALKYQEPGTRGQEPTGTPDSRPPTADSRLTEAAASGELLTLKLRYKEPDGDVSKLLEVPLKDRGGSLHAASKDMQFAAAVASFGMILRGSEHRGTSSLPAVAEIAGGAIGEDKNGYRAEFVDLVRKAAAIGAR
jgi:Ca-activated chloride channel family protein